MSGARLNECSHGYPVVFEPAPSEGPGWVKPVAPTCVVSDECHTQAGLPFRPESSP